MILSRLITDFLQDLESKGNVSRLTVRNYRHYLNRFLDFSSDINPKDINFELINKYKKHLEQWVDPTNNKPLKPVTQNYFLIALRSLLRYMYAKNILKLDIEKISLQESKPPQLQVLDSSQFKLLIDSVSETTLEALRDKAILETLFSTGVRVSELCSFNRDTPDLEGQEFLVGKGNKQRSIVLPESACIALQKYLNCRKDTFKPLFIRFQGKVNLENKGESMRLSVRSIQRIVEKYVRLQNLEVKVTPQTLRHSFAADLLSSGVDTRSVAHMLGNNLFVKLK